LARLEKERADENLKQLRDKVDRLSELGRDLAKDPARDPRLRTAALALLQEALDFYDKILPQETIDPRLREEAARMYGEVAGTYHATGKWHQSLGAYWRQAELLAAMAREEPAHEEHNRKLALSYRACGNVLRDLGETPDARAAYQQAVELQERLMAESPGNLDLQVALSNTLLNLTTTMSPQGEAEEIEKVFRRVVKLDRAAVDADGPGSRFLPELALALDGLGMRLLDSGKIDDARAAIDESLKTYKELLKVHAQNDNFKRYVARSYTNHGRVLAAAGEVQDAEQAHKEAVTLLTTLVARAGANPFFRMELAITLSSWADLLKKTDRQKDAEDLLRQAIGHYKTLKGGFPEARRNSQQLVVSYMKLVSWLWEFGREGDAVEPYRLAFEVAPDDPVVNNDLAWILATNPERRLWKPAEAVRLAQQAVKARPRDGNFWNTLGVAHYRNGDDKAAIAALETSMKLSTGGDGSDWFFLAMAHWRLGDRDEARKWFGQAVRWMDKHLPRDAELRRFRAEAEATLGAKDKS
jgi:tetratricopeptide (TPR) repeat protein